MHQPGALILVVLVLGASSRSERGVRRRVSAIATITTGLLLSGTALLLAASVGAWLSARCLTSARDALPAERLPLLLRAARLDPRSGEAALVLGLAHLELGDAPAALRELARSRSLLANIGTDIAIGNAHMLAGAPERAIAAYTRALARHPGYFRAHANMAEALTSLGRLTEAEAHLATAQSLWPGHPKLPLIAERLRRARIEAETSEPPPP
jgi:tetratricopeptide (TPR) repeat protein